MSDTMTDAEIIKDLRKSLARAANLLSYIIDYQQEDPRGVDTFDGRSMISYRDEFQTKSMRPIPVVLTGADLADPDGDFFS